MKMNRVKIKFENENIIKGYTEFVPIFHNTSVNVDFEYFFDKNFKILLSKFDEFFVHLYEQSNEKEKFYVSFMHVLRELILKEFISKSEFKRLGYWDIDSKFKRRIEICGASILYNKNIIKTSDSHVLLYNGFVNIYENNPDEDFQCEEYDFCFNSLFNFQIY
jgi:hypothetical protein